MDVRSKEARFGSLPTRGEASGESPRGGPEGRSQGRAIENR
ncbi:MAG: hypothetical protein AVDCRST_MAG08-1089 [uncultured Acetobacteraceae bacterium]|uniref:Uncharacterized protein n=1 Tax=uncultured Acetobacteraceae bacterium TaxID=169975 RepID=A0A6J4HSE9_9PROT|nr:MAG: hypothetical protein AVDCRST_MAG08-1089 [uncultured Acetobacteraceae bacterium]